MSINTKKPKPKSYPKSIQSLSDAIQAKRMDLKLSKAQLAKTLRVSPQTLNSWGKGNKTPIPKTMKRIIKFLDYVPPLGIEKNTLAYELYKYRCIHGLTQHEIALILKMDIYAVTRIENNEKVSPRYIERVQNFIR